MLYSLPAILGVLIKDAIKGGDDELLPEKLVREQAGYLLDTFRGVNALADSKTNDLLVLLSGSKKKLKKITWQCWMNVMQ